MDKELKRKEKINYGILFNYSNLISLINSLTSEKIINTEKFKSFILKLSMISRLNINDIDDKYFPFLKSTHASIKNIFNSYSVNNKLSSIKELDRAILELNKIEYIYGKFIIKEEFEISNNENKNITLTDNLSSYYENLKTDSLFLGNMIIQSEKYDSGFTKNNYFHFYRLQEDIMEIIKKMKNLIYDEKVNKNKKEEMLDYLKEILSKSNAVLNNPNKTTQIEKNFELIYKKLNELDKLINSSNSQSFNKIK